MDFLHSKELEEFYENYDKKHPDEISAKCRNIYDIKTVDRKGNVVDQKFGLNLMTDFGFQKAYKYCEYLWDYNTDLANCYRIWIGDGLDYPKYGNNSLYSRITSSGPQNSVGKTSEYDGMRYDKTTKLCSMMRKAQSGYYDYNISDLDGNTITEDKYIREIGIGAAWNELRMHAKVYDKNGEESSITKKPNQRLYITTYITTTMDPSYITDAYNNGEYIAVDMRHGTRIVADDTVNANNERIGYTALSSSSYLVSHYRWTSQKPFYGYGSNNGSWNVYNETDHTITFNSQSGGGGMMEGKYQYISEEESIVTDSYLDVNVDNSRVRDGSAIGFRFVNCEEAEELENVTTFTNDRTSGKLSNSFGLPYHSSKSRGRIPATDGDVHKISMYNHHTKEWDIEEEFINNPELQLYDYWMARYASVWMYITFMKSNKMAYVFINPHTDRPILSFVQSGFTLYATDEYWDTDSWEAIGNIKAVPEELRCKRYYISLTDPQGWADLGRQTYDYGNLARGRGLIPNREMTTHEIIPVSPYKTYTLPHTAPYNNSRVVSNNELGYVAYPNCLFYPDAINPETELPYAYKLTDESGMNVDEGYIFGIGKKIFVMGKTGDRSGAYFSTRNGQNMTNGYPPDDRVTLVSNQTYYYPTSFGGEAIGFRVYTIGDTPSEAPTYEDFKFPTIRYNPTRWGWESPPRWGAGFDANNRDNYFIRYEQPYPSISTNGFIVLSTLHPGLNTSYPFPTIINLYGGEDGNTVEIDELKDYKMGMAVAMTDYVCLMNKNTSVPYQYELYNVETKEVEQTFEFESGYTVMGYAGWKNYIYFLTNYNSERRSFVYHIDTKTLEYCPTETFWFLNGLQKLASDTSDYIYYDAYRATSVAYSSSKFTLNSVANDEVVIFSSNISEGDWSRVPAYSRDYGQCYFTSDNPTHRQYVVPSMENYDGFTTYHSNGDLKYINNEDKQLIYIAGSQNRIVIQDMGLQIDKPEGFDVDFYPKYEMPWYADHTVPSNCIFKDRVFLIKPSTGVVQELPIEYCIRHKLDVSTHTITSFNNPVRVSASKGFTWSATNRVDPKGE